MFLNVTSLRNRPTQNILKKKACLRFFLDMILFSGCCLIAGDLVAADQAKVDFARDVQPIFIKRCYECHGPDKQKSELRFDRKTDAFKGGKSGTPLLVAGKSAESELIKRVTSKDEDEVMPAKGERLTPEQ